MALQHDGVLRNMFVTKVVRTLEGLINALTNNVKMVFELVMFQIRGV